MNKIKFENLKLGMKVKVNVNNKKVFTGEIIDINERERLVRVNGHKFKNGKDFHLWVGDSHIEEIIEKNLKEEIIERIQTTRTKKILVNLIADYIQDTVPWIAVLKIDKQWGYMVFDCLEEEDQEVLKVLEEIDPLCVIMQGYEIGNTSKLSIHRYITYFRNIYKEYLIEKSKEEEQNKNNRIDKDKFIKVKKFKTALKQLHKLIHKNKFDDEIFNYDEMLMFYEEGLKEFYKLLENKQSIYETRNELIKNKELCYSTPWEFHYSWKHEDELTNDISFFRINICNDGEHWNYIDCGYTVE